MNSVTGYTPPPAMSSARTEARAIWRKPLALAAALALFGSMLFGASAALATQASAQASNIVFTPPNDLEVLAGRVLVVDASAYASAGNHTITCGTASTNSANISLQSSGCSVAVTAGMAGGSASFSVPYISSGGGSRFGTFSLSVRRTIRGTVIPLLNSANCVDGTFVDLTANPRVTGANNDLAEDCIALVAIQNHFAAVEANRILPTTVSIRSWGTGSATNMRIDNWVGVTIASNRVTGLSFGPTNKISGAIPSAMQNLTALTALDFDSHNLSGNIPSSLGSVSTLTTLDLSNNALLGPIPSELSQLTSLTMLKLSGNQLSGSIPSGMGSLTSVTQLHLNNNQLSGSIPSDLGSMTALQQLNLSNNRLTGIIPDSLTSLTSLTVLALENNRLGGGIPAQIGSLTELTALHLHNNRLSGTIPAGMSSLTKLTRLRLNDNQLTGSIPDAIGALVTLNSGGTSFTGLSQVYICRNYLSGSVPTGLQQKTTANLYALQEYPVAQGFDIVACQFAPDAELVSVYPVIPKLDASLCTGGGFLPLAPNGFLVQDCRALVGAQNHWADVNANRNLGEHHFLRTWGTGRTVLITSWEGVIIDKGRVTSLNLSGKSLRGSVPPILGGLSALQTLDISNNYMDDDLPHQLGYLSSVKSFGQATPGVLTFLNFCSNYLTGEIPTALLDNASDIAFGPLAELFRPLLSVNPTIVCQSPGDVPTSPVRYRGASYAEVLSGGAMVHLVRSSLGLSSDGQIFHWDATTSKWIMLPHLTCTERDSANACTTWAQNTASLPVGALIYYVDGYIDPPSLARANLRRGSSPADRIANMVFTPPALVPVRAGGSSVFIDANSYFSGTALGLAFTCGDATGAAVTSGDLTITRSGCSYQITAPASSSRASRDVTFNMVYTPVGVGASARNGAVTVRILPVSDIAFSAPRASSVGRGGSVTIDASRSATDGPYAITCGNPTDIDRSRLSSVTRRSSGNGCSFRVTGTDSPGSGTFTVPLFSSGGDTSSGEFTVRVTTADPEPVEPTTDPISPPVDEPDPETQRPSTSTEVPEEQEEEETDDASTWNTFTVQGSGTTAREMRERLGLPADQALYTWNAETQVWAQVASPTSTIPAGATISFLSERELDAEELETAGLGSDTQEASLSNGWNIINVAGDIEYDQDRDFLVDYDLIDCGRLQGVLAITSYNANTRRWSLWLPCHPRSQARLTTGENPTYDPLTSVSQGDSIYIYIRSRIPTEIAWNAETQTYELS